MLYQQVWQEENTRKCTIKKQFVISNQKQFELIKLYIVMRNEEREQIHYNNQTWRCTYLPCSNKGLCCSSIAAAIARSDEVGHTTALQKGRCGNHAILRKELGEGYHLHQAQTDHSCLGVVSTLQAITKTCTHCNDVLHQQWTKQKHTFRKWCKALNATNRRLKIMYCTLFILCITSHLIKLIINTTVQVCWCTHAPI